MVTTSGIAGYLPAAYETSFWTRVRRVERRQWWLWASAIIITLLLTAGIGLFAYGFEHVDPSFTFILRDSLRGLVALVFLFDLYTIYQQVQIHRIRRQLSEQEQMFRLIAENAEDLITLVDRQGRRLYDSPGYYRLGYTHDELQEVPIDEQIHPDDREKLAMARAEIFTKGTGERLEYRFLRRDGEWRILESTGSPVRNHKNEIEKVVFVSRDITERRRAEERLLRQEEQLRQAQKMEAVGQLSGGIAHDFNNLLAVIIGYGESMEQRLAPNDPLRKSAEEIRKAGERAAALTHQLLAFSRQQVLQPKILDLNVLVSDMGQMLRRLIGMDIELSTQLAPQLGRVKADQSQIEQVVVNLVVNARDAMPEGGNLIIETSNLEVDDDLSNNLPFLHPGAYVLLTVKDTGIGMDANTRRHIFEPFFTTKGPGKGTGLGLATVYGVVKQSGGGVTVESEPGKGSTFKIYLPQAVESAEALPQGVKGAQSSLGTGTILLAEDEEALLNLTAERLTVSGYNVLAARDGIQALELARSFNGTIQLLLTDLAMPRMGGMTLARTLSQLRPGTRVVFMTGRAEQEASPQAPLFPVSESIQKPFSHEQLIRSVRKALEATPVPVES
jgi:two-component system, cell cycle sensor histidine kinase and response regulator CckA